ncbi:MAG: TetR family transcriptional regulator [Actinomycetota bacterium]|nr:TetR family transcriptional regulator [Actinomycetota bacterium]
MSIPYELQGRRQQKARTRAALVEAARDLMAEGVTPTVERAAERAAVARTTAYRYFPNQRALLVAVFPDIDATSLLGAEPPSDPEERLNLFTENFARQILDHEPELRASLHIALDPGASNEDPLPFRRGRAIGWIEDVLIPLQGRMPQGRLRRLALAIRATIGIEALVWLTDVGGLSRAEAVVTMRWSAQALLRSALEGVPPPSLDTIDT